MTKGLKHQESILNFNIYASNNGFSKCMEQKATELKFKN